MQVTAIKFTYNLLLLWKLPHMQLIPTDDDESVDWKFLDIDGAKYQMDLPKCLCNEELLELCFNKSNWSEVAIRVDINLK